MEELRTSEFRQDWTMDVDGFMLRYQLCPPEGLLIIGLQVERSHRIIEHDIHGCEVGSSEVPLDFLFGQLFMPLPVVQCPQQFHDPLSEVLHSLGVDSSHHQEIIQRILSFVSETMARTDEGSRALQIFAELHIFTLEDIMVPELGSDEEESEFLLRSESEYEGVKRGVPEQLVGELRERHGFRANKNEGLGTCPICLENLVVEDGEGEPAQLIKMPCSESHVFHDHCIVMWFKTSNSCPLCRFAIG